MKSIFNTIYNDSMKTTGKATWRFGHFFAMLKHTNNSLENCEIFSCILELFCIPVRTIVRINRFIGKPINKGGLYMQFVREDVRTQCYPAAESIGNWRARY